MLTFFSRVIRLFLVVTLFGVTLVAAGAAVAPQIAALKGAVQGEADGDVVLAGLEIRSELFDRDGNLIHRFSTDGSNREVLQFDEMPEQVITSVLTIEDEDFMAHPGLNLRATFRALVENVGAGGISQGGSTVTQQLVKNLVLGPEDEEELCGEVGDRCVQLKVREATLSWRLEQILEKDEILETYLNTVYLGSGAYGVQAAAEVYFGKDARDLDWPEAAMLAALISSPADYDPFLNPADARRQREIVFNRLVAVGAIDAEEARFYNRVPLPSNRNELVDVPPRTTSSPKFAVAFLTVSCPLTHRKSFLTSSAKKIRTRLASMPCSAAGCGSTPRMTAPLKPRRCGPVTRCCLPMIVGSRWRWPP